MSSYLDLVRKANEKKKPSTEKIKGSNVHAQTEERSSYLNLVRKVNSGSVKIATKMDRAQVEDWYKNISSVSRRGYDYINRDGYRTADTAITSEVDKYLEQADEVEHYIRVNRDSFENYDQVLQDYYEAIRSLQRMQEGVKGTNSYYAQWENEDAYIKGAVEAADQRQQRYEDNQKRIEELQAEWDAYEYDWTDATQREAADKKHAEIQSEIERLKADNLQYEGGEGGYINKKVDEHRRTTENDDYSEGSAKRDYTNATREELWNYDMSVEKGREALSNLGYFDDDGNVLDFHGNIVQSANAPVVEDKLGMFLNASPDEVREAYDNLIANNGNATNTWERFMQEGDLGSWRYLTDQEIGIYYYYLRESQEKAYNYLSDMKTELNRRQTLDESGQWYDAYDKANSLEKFAMNVATVPSQLVSGVAGFVEDTVNTVAGKEINPYSAAHGGMHYTQTVRGATAEDLDATGLKIPGVDFTLGDLYQSGMSMADSLLAMGVGGTLGGALLATGAAENEAYRLYQQGASTGQIAFGAAAAGATELIFESLSLGELDKIKNMKSPKTLGQFFKTLLVQGGVEASEEAMTEIANTVANAFIMGSQSDWTALMEENGGNLTGALMDKTLDVLHSGLGGFFSGTGSGGIVGGSEYAHNSARFRNIGNAIVSGGQVDALKALAMDVAGVSTDSKTQKALTKQASKVTTKAKGSNAVKVGKLYDAVQTANRVNNANANQSDIVKSLTRKGFTTETATDIAGALVAAYNGKTLTKAQAKLLESAKGSKAVQEAVEKIVKNAASTMGQREQSVQALMKDANLANIAKAANISVEQLKQIYEKAQSGELTKEDLVNAETTYNVSTDGKTIYQGDVVAVKEIASIKDGKMTLRLENGAEVDSRALSYGTEAEALVYEVVAGMGVDVKTANSLVEGFQIQNSSNLQAATDYAHGISTAFRYGMYNYSMDELSDTDAAKLSKPVRELAYNQGQKVAGKQVAKEQAKAKEGKNPKVAKKHGSEMEGYSNVRAEGDVQRITEKREAELKFMDFVAREFAGGAPVYVYESYYDKQKGYRVYKDSNGVVRRAPNGKYRVGGEIWVDLNAGMKGEGFMLNTFAHELTHFIFEQSPAKAKKLANFLVEQYGKSGQSVEELVRARMKKSGLSYAEAFEEVVADSMERMFVDGDVMSKLLELKKQDSGLFNMIKQFIDKWVSKLRKYYGKDGIYVTTIGKQASELEQFEKLQQLFAEALVDAGENYQKAQKNTTDAGGVRYSENSSEIIDLSSNSELSNRINGLYGAEKYKAIQQYILEVLQNEPVILSDGKKAVVDRSDALHIANKAGVEKTAQIAEIKKIVESAILYAEDLKAEHKKFNQFLYYKADVRFKGEEFPLYVNVGKAKNDGSFHIYDITKKIRDTADRINGLERPNQNEGNALESDISNNSIRNSNGIVNTETEKTEEKKSERDEEFDYSGLNWATELGIITAKDRAIFERTINNEIYRGAKPQSANGEYIIDTGKCLLFTDGDFHRPTLSRVIEFATEYESLTDYAKRRIIDEAKVTGDIQESISAIESIFGEGFVSGYTKQDGRTYAGQNRGGKGSSRSGTHQKARSLKEILAAEGKEYLLDDDAVEQESYSDRDDAYMESVNRMDMETVQQFADEDIRYSERTFKNGQNAKGEFIAKILIDLADSNSEWWTGRYNRGILGMSKTNDTEFRQFYQEIERRTKDLEEYDGAAQTAVTDAFTVQDGNGKEYVYRVELDGYMHGVVLEKIDLAKHQKAMQRYERGKGNGRSYADIGRRINNARTDLGGHSSGNSGRVSPGGTAGPGGMGGRTSPSNQARNDSRGQSVNQTVSNAAGSNNTELESARVDDAISNRALLVNALESTITDDKERSKIAEYKASLEAMEAEETKLRELNAQIKELSFAKGKRDMEKIRKLRDDARKTTNRINIYDKQLLRLEAAKPLQKVLERERKRAYDRAKQKNKEAMAEYKKSVDEKFDAITQQYREQRKEAVAKVREISAKRDVRQKILSFKKRMEQRLLRPTDTQYVPAGLAKAMVEVCELINTDTDLYKADGSINKAQERRNLTKEKLGELAAEYKKLAKHSDPAYQGEFDETFLAYLEQLRDDYAGKNLSDLTLDELRDMYDILRSIEETLQDAKKLIGWGENEGVYEAGDAIVAEQAAIIRKRKNGKRNAAQKVSDANLNNSLSTMRNVERMAGYNQDSMLLKLFKKLEQGVRKKNFFTMNAYKSFEALTSQKAYEDAVYKEAGEKKFTDSFGREFGLSKMQMMQAVLSYERETANNMHHIEKGGFTFADLDMLRNGKVREAVSAENAHRVSNATNLVAEFTEILKDDAWCKEYMKAARVFFNETAKNAVNETMLALKHRIVAKDKNYIPFEVDQNFVSMEISAEQRIQQTINAYGMLKETKSGAAQPLYITGLNNIIERHIEMVGNVYGLAVEVRNFNKVWNARSNVSGHTVKEMLDAVWGTDGVKNLTQAVMDIQGPRDRKRKAVYDKVKSGYIGATFMLNLSVVTKQIGSMFAATSMLNWRGPVRQMANLIRTMANHKKISAEVDQYTATAWMRRQGLSDAELHTLMTEGKKTWLGKLTSKLPSAINPTKWITAMDHVVALSLWEYAKADVAKKTGLKGEELLKATAEFYDEVVENTQSMTDVLHRPEIQKKDGVVAESFAMFKTDLYQMAGQLHAAAGRYAANKTSENGRALGRTVYAVAMSAIWGQLMTTVFALLRYKVDPYRDEEDDLTVESWLKRQSFALAGDLMGYIVPLFGSEAVGVVENIVYGESDDAVDSIALTTINTLYEALVNAASALKDGEIPDPAVMKKIVVNALQCFGVPANNILRTLEAIKLHAEDIANGEFLSFEAGADRSVKQYMHKIVEAVDSGDADIARGLYEETVEELAIRKAGAEYTDEDMKAVHTQLQTSLGELYKEGQVSVTVAEKILALLGKSEDEIYWIIDKWDYALETGSSDGYAKYDDFYKAVETGKNLKQTIQKYTDNGVTEETLRGQITNYFKPKYLAMSRREKTEIIGYLINAYCQLGYTRTQARKLINNWKEEEDE